MPIRIQRSRKKGWRMPPGAIYVGRTNAIERTGWSNPFRIGGYFMVGDPEPQFTLIADQAMAVDFYRRLVANWDKDMIDRCRSELGGHDLACWCRLDAPCHADVLLEIANRV